MPKKRSLILFPKSSDEFTPAFIRISFSFFRFFYSHISTSHCLPLPKLGDFRKRICQSDTRFRINPNIPYPAQTVSHPVRDICHTAGGRDPLFGKSFFFQGGYGCFGCQTGVGNGTSERRVLLGFPPQYFSVIPAMNERRSAPCVSEAAKRISPI